MSLLLPDAFQTLKSMAFLRDVCTLGGLNFSLMHGVTAFPFGVPIGVVGNSVSVKFSVVVDRCPAGEQHDVSPLPLALLKLSERGRRLFVIIITMQMCVVVRREMRLSSNPTGGTLFRRARNVVRCKI